MGNKAPWNNIDWSGKSMNVDALYLKIKEGSVIEYIPDSGRQSIDKTFIKKKKERERQHLLEWNQSTHLICISSTGNQVI